MPSSLKNPYKTRHAKFLVENLNLPRATGVEDAAWEHFQLDLLNDDSPFRLDKKSRQIAFSFIAAAEAVAKAMCYADPKRSYPSHLKPDSIFVSINHEESKEKIRYAKSVYENLEIGGLPKLTTDNQLELEFDNGARISSMPSKGPRGRAKSNVYLDEFAHVQHDRQIYTAAIPIISKGGVLRIGSSTFGASGVFWEIDTESMQKYPGYTRKSTPWWEVQAFCRNVREAKTAAPALTTFQRVELFGNERIKAIYANLPEEDFQQEYEAIYVDETTAWITWDEIAAAQKQGADLDCIIAEGKADDMGKIYEAVNELKRLVQENKIESVFGVGMDIGRTKNASEIYAVGCSNLDVYPLRLALTLNNCEFDQQLTVLSTVLETLGVKKALIDQTGLGRNLAENAMQKYPAKAEGVDFTLQSKVVWATDAKMLIQKLKTPLPVNRDIAYQIHAIKRIVTAAKNVVFDTVRNERHHADKFWAWVLALAAAKTETVENSFGDEETYSEWNF